MLRKSTHLVENTFLKFFHYLREREWERKSIWKAQNIRGFLTKIRAVIGIWASFTDQWQSKQAPADIWTTCLQYNNFACVTISTCMWNTLIWGLYKISEFLLLLSVVALKFFSISMSIYSLFSNFSTMSVFYCNTCY